MRACDKLQRGLAADRIHRNPEAAVLVSADVVIRVIVVQAHGSASHKPGTDLCERRPEDQLAIVAVFLPAAEILDKPPRIVAGARNQRARAGMRQILIAAGLEGFALPSVR